MTTLSKKITEFSSGRLLGMTARLDQQWTGVKGYLRHKACARRQYVSNVMILFWRHGLKVYGTPPNMAVISPCIQNKKHYSPSACSLLSAHDNTANPATIPLSSFVACNMTCATSCGSESLGWHSKLKV